MAASHNAGPASRYQADELTAIPDPALQTTAGLPRRVPRTSAYPGAGGPDFGQATDLDGSRAPAPGASADGMAVPQGTPYREPAYQEQTVSRRRSPEAARIRLSGFQLGSREAVQAGLRTGQASHAGEEKGR